jgi:hypothetical protein
MEVRPLQTELVFIGFLGFGFVGFLKVHMQTEMNKCAKAWRCIVSMESPPLL